jgi:hypothetical protein
VPPAGACLASSLPRTVRARVTDAQQMQSPPWPSKLDVMHKTGGDSAPVFLANNRGAHCTGLRGGGGELEVGGDAPQSPEVNDDATRHFR